MSEEKKSVDTADKQDKTEEVQALEENNKEVKSIGDKTDDKKEVEVPAKFKSIVEEIEKMSVLDLSELVKILEDKFGVSAVAPMAVAAAPSGTGGEGEAGKEEKTEFTVELTATGDNKIGVIKAIRAVTEMGLKDAKDLAEGAPAVVKEGVKKEEADTMKKTLEEAGAQVTLK